MKFQDEVIHINAANNILKQGLKELGLSYIKIH